MTSKQTPGKAVKKAPTELKSKDLDAVRGGNILTNNENVSILKGGPQKGTDSVVDLSGTDLGSTRNDRS